MKIFLLITFCSLLLAENSFAQYNEEYSEDYEAIDAVESGNSANGLSETQFIMQNEAEDSQTDIRQEKASETANVTTKEKHSSQKKYIGSR